MRILTVTASLTFAALVGMAAPAGAAPMAAGSAALPADEAGGVDRAQSHHHHRPRHHHHR